MKLRRFCAKCGSQLNEGDVIYEGFLCTNCHGDVSEPYILPKALQLRQCIFCKAFSIRDPQKDQEYHWGYQPPDENDLDFVSRLLYEQIFFSLEQKQKLTYEIFLPDKISVDQIEDMQVHVEVKGADTINYVDGEFEVKFRKIHCPYCAQRQGGRFDAIVQIRIQHKKDKPRVLELVEEVRRIEKKANFENLQHYIVILDTVTNGFDLKVSNNAMARLIISKMRDLHPFEVKHSKRLMGIDGEDGTRLYRHSTLLRLVPVVRGDKIHLEGTDYRVHNITKRKVVLQDIHSQKVHQVNFAIFQKKAWVLLEDSELN